MGESAENHRPLNCTLRGAITKGEFLSYVVPSCGEGGRTTLAKLRLLKQPESNSKPRIARFYVNKTIDLYCITPNFVIPA